MNPLLQLLSLIARALGHARATSAAGDAAEAQRALAAAQEMVEGAVADALAEQQRRAHVYRAPFANN